MADPALWNDRERAKAVSTRLAHVKEDIHQWDGLMSDIHNCLEIAGLDEKDQDVNLVAELTTTTDQIESTIAQKEFTLLFSGAYDKRDAIVSIHAGSGGTEAQDWAEMLLRMILRFCERRGFNARLVSESRGEVAGIKSATLVIKGWAYGWLKSEAGVHRLVRISPFDAEQMRHTSFAAIDVIPTMEALDEIDIDPNDIRVDTYLSSGHGGQSVQTTYSAVRIVHIPTNIIVTCQNERSQLQNKETALAILKSKLLKIRLETQEKERQALRGEQRSVEWGSQIRSYVLHPYKMVKDHRTQFETKEPDKVLEGGLEPFVESYLQWLNKLS